MRWLLSLGIVPVLMVIGVFIYLNQVGLPPFAKSLLQAELRANGLNLEFKRLRWRLERGLVAEGVQLDITSTNAQPTLVADELKIRLNRQALLTGTPEISSVLLSNGQLGLPLLSEDSLDALQFDVNDVQTKLSFPSPNLWLLDNFHATCLGIQMTLQAEITNAFALKSWRAKRRPQSAPPKWPRILQQILQIRNDVEFTGTPTLAIKLSADAAHPEKSTADLNLQCEAMDSPWGSMQDFSLRVAADEPVSESAPEFSSRWTLAIGQLDREDVSVKSLVFSGNFTHDAVSGAIRSANWTLNSGPAKHLLTEMDSVQVIGTTHPKEELPDWLQSAMEFVIQNAAFKDGAIQRTRLSTNLRHQGLNWRTAEGSWEATLEKTHTQWANIDQCTLDGQVRHAAPTAAPGPPLTGPWRHLEDLLLTLNLSAQGVEGDTVEAESFNASLSWSSPNLQIERIQSELYRGGLDFTGSLGAIDRRVSLDGRFDFDVHQIMHLLTEKGRRWLRQYQFELPPKVHVKAQVTLPEWDDPNPDWRGEVKPSMSIDGGFTVGKAAFRTVPVTAASSSIQFTNMTWRLPDLHVKRPEGNMLLDYECDARTQDYQWRIDTLVDYHALAPLLSPSQQKGLALFKFSAPVRTVGEIWGRWHSPELIRLKTLIEASDFSFRGVPIETLETDLAYVNGLLTATKPFIERQEGFLQADQVQFNSRTQLITLSNALSTADTAAIAKVIGPRIERSFESYRFAEPPRIEANGIIPVKDMSAADAHFNVTGGPFSFWRFNVPDIDARVDWVGREVKIQDVEAPFYEGTLDGDMTLQLIRGGGTEFSLDAIVREANLNDLFTDVLSPESKSEGKLSGHIVIGSGKSDDWNSWQGNGQVKLRNGLLWDTPLFGIFSPVLNTLSPGLGNSRAGSGEADFTITDSIISTSNLVIQEPATRLQYQGDLDFEGNLDARVEAELLRDAPMVGRVVSMALWPVSKLFVYNVKGNLREPIAEPVYVLPKFLMNPIDSLRNRKD